MKTRKSTLVYLITIAVLLGIFSCAYAFIGPATGQSPGSGGGLLIASSTRALGIATTTIYSTESQMLFKTLGGTDQHIIFSPNGYVGIATTTPSEMLYVFGNIKTSGSFIGALSGSLSAANVSSEVFGRLQGEGNFAFPASLGVATSSEDGLPQSLSVYGGGYFSGSVGIGTDSPDSPLEINGDAHIGELYLDDSWATVGFGMERSSGSYVYSVTGEVPYRFIMHKTNNNFELQYYDTGTIGNALTGEATVMAWKDGKVGIGTTTPSSALTISGNLDVSGTITGSAISGTVDAENINAGNFGGGGGIWSFSGAAQLGIGTSTPEVQFEIVGPASGVQDAELHLEATGTDQQSIIRFQDNDGDLFGFLSNYPSAGKFTLYNYQQEGFYGENAIVVDAASQIGFGTSTPGYKLDVRGGSNLIRARRINAGPAAMEVEVQSGGDDYAAYFMGVPNDSWQGGMRFYPDTQRLEFMTNGNAKMVISTGGNVGIGAEGAFSTQPASLLTVALDSGEGPQYDLNKIGSYNLLLRAGVTVPGTMVGIALHPGTDNEPSSEVFTAITAKRIDNDNAEIGFVTRGGGTLSQKVVIQADGNVGIGTASPTSPLYIDASTHNGAAMIVDRYTSGAVPSIQAGPSNPWLMLEGQSTTGNVGVNYYSSGDVILAYGGGDVGIGTASPAAKLHVVGDLVVSKTYRSPIVNKGNKTGAVTIDWSEANTQMITLTGNVTITHSNGQSGGRYTLVLKQDGTGSRTATWANSEWGDSGTPTLSTGANLVDYAGFVFNDIESNEYHGIAFNSGF